MPLTEKGEHVLDQMRSSYGSDEKAKQVFYSMINSGKLTGVHMHEESMRANNMTPEERERNNLC